MFTPEFRNRLDAVIAVRRPAARGHHEGGGEVRVPARGAAGRPRRHHRAVGGGGASGWPRTATTRSSAPGRSRASSRSTSRSRWPTSCCSASCVHGGTVRVLVDGRGRGAQARLRVHPGRAQAQEGQGRGRGGRRRRRGGGRGRSRRWSRPPRARRCPAPRTRRIAPSPAAPYPACRAARTSRLSATRLRSLGGRPACESQRPFDCNGPTVSQISMNHQRPVWCHPAPFRAMPQQRRFLGLTSAGSRLGPLICRRPRGRYARLRFRPARAPLDGSR